MSRPLFEYITHPEKAGLSRRTKTILLVSVIVFHVVVLYFAFTAKLPMKILKLGAKVYTVNIAPPLPEFRPGTGPAETPAGAPPGAAPRHAGVQPARPANMPSGGGVQAGPTGGAASPSLQARPSAGLRYPFSLKAPFKPGPIGPEELQRSIPGGTPGASGTPSTSTKFWVYTKTDPWGRTPAAGSEPGSGLSPGGPLGSSYELISSGTGPKVLYRGNPSLVSRGYNIAPWAKVVMALLQKNWQLPSSDRAKSTGRVGVTIIVEKSGTLSTLRLIDSPNDQILVRAALDAITRSLPLPQLPEDYPGLRLEAYLLFDYHEAR